MIWLIGFQEVILILTLVYESQVAKQYSRANWPFNIIYGVASFTNLTRA